MAIHPTPVVGVLGVVDDVAKRVPMAFREMGDVVLLLGETRDELAGSEWAHVVHGHLGGLPPKVDLEAERALATVLVTASRSGIVTAAHDLSDGGVAQAVVEMALRHGVGATIDAPAGLDPFVFLFSESTARAIVTATADHVEKVVALATQHGVPVQRIGVVTGPADDVQVDLVDGSTISLELEELRAASEATLPALFG